MPETTRTFIAIPIPEPVAAQLGRWQRALAPQIPACRWAENQPPHITLAFLGDVENRDLNRLCLAVAEAVEPFGRFDLNVAGVGAFPGPDRPRVVWAGITADDLKPLLEVREAVVGAASRSGYRPEDMRFHPHVTLGRIKAERGRPCDLTGLLRREQARAAGSFTVAEVVTYSSTLEPTGPVYAALNRARLKGKKTEASH